MALTAFQRTVCRLLAQTRVASGESYVAGGAALNTLVPSSRLSRDVDVFHDTEAAVTAAWDADRKLLEQSGYSVRGLRERPGYVEAIVEKHDETLVLQWLRDSAYRFFPLMAHDDLGLTLHPFDLATNKVLALVGRLEVRDWIDVISCTELLQPLGYLAWAACGKDPAFSPRTILNQAARSGRYTASEVATLAFDGAVPDVTSLAQRWKAQLSAGEAILSILPAAEAGKCVLSSDGALLTEESGNLEQALNQGRVFFHEGTIRGAYPTLASSSG